jgi:hypothetical protein
MYQLDASDIFIEYRLDHHQVRKMEFVYVVYCVGKETGVFLRLEKVFATEIEALEYALHLEKENGYVEYEYQCCKVE